LPTNCEWRRGSWRSGNGAICRTPLVGLAERLGTPEVDHILGRLSAAYEQGLPLGQALPAHAQALRERQRLHIVEEGGKASVRMLLPVALLILPALFVVVLVPAAAELTRLGG
jgi:tight adherence protein C